MNSYKRHNLMKARRRYRKGVVYRLFLVASIILLKISGAIPDGLMIAILMSWVVIAPRKGESL